MIDTLDLDMLRQQIVRVEWRLKLVRIVLWFVAGVFLLLAIGAAILGFLLADVELTAGRGGSPSQPGATVSETTILSNQCQCVSTLNMLAVVALVNAGAWGVLLPQTLMMIRQYSFGSRRETKKALVQLNIANTTSASKRYTLLILISVLVIVVIIIAPVLLMMRNIDFDDTTSSINDLIRIVIYLVVVLVASGGYLLLRYGVPQYIYKNVAARGHYEQAIQNLRRLRPFIHNNITIDLMQGVVLGLMDRGKEAQQIYQDFFAKEHHYNFAALAAVGLNNLAYEYVMEQRYEEAQPLFETGIKLYPPQPQPYHNLAWLYLERGDQPERAVELIKFAIAITPRKAQDSQASFMATLAWAYAVNGDRSNAEKFMTNAQRLVNRNRASYLAFVHYMAGRTNQALGEAKQAQAQFTLAVRLDPRGRSGHKSQQIIGGN